MKKVLLVTNQEKEGSCKLAHRAMKYLKDHCEIVGECSSFDEDLNRFGADFAITFGGDGTVLNAVRRFGTTQIPIITVNLGRLGFLAEVNPDDLESMLNKFLEGKVRVSERMRLQVDILRNGENIFTQLALNEISFISVNCGRVCTLNLAIDGRHLTTISGDGLVVSTATGSTAYALSAGGPILSHLLSSMVIVPVCAHRLTNRPLVISKHEKLQVSGLSSISCDGINSLPITASDTVHIKCSSSPALLITCSKESRYDTLRRKLNWGE